MAKTDIEIAREAKMKPIQEILNSINVPDKAEVYSPIGRYIAKIKLEYLEKLKDKKDGKLILVTAITPTTFTGTHSVSGSTSGNVNVYLPTDFVFYLVSVSTVTGTTQFLPLFTANVESVVDDQSFSLTEKLILPLINSPVPHAGGNFTSATSTLAPKLRGLMLPRGSGIYVGVSGIGSLTNGFYVNVQGGYY